MTKKKNRLNVFFIGFALVSLFVIASIYVGKPTFISEILIQSQAHIAVLFALMFFVFLLYKAHFLAVFQFFAFVCILAPVLSWPTENKSFSQCNVVDPEASFRLMSHNVYYKNPDYDAVLHLTKTLRPDIILLQEYNDKLSEQIGPELEAHYPFSYHKKSGQNFAYSGLYSRYPISNVQIIDLENVPYGALYAEISINDHVAHVIGIHTPSPITATRIKERGRHIQALSKFISEQLEDEATVIAGDFNTVPWHQDMTAFLEETKYHGAYTKNLYGTWPAFSIFPFLRIPIDHIFYSKELIRRQYDLTTLTGSDHVPIYADFYFCE